MFAEQHTLTISRAAAELNCSANWLRLAERLGAIPAARRTPGGQRRYTPEDVQLLKQLGVGQRPGRLRTLEEVSR